MSLRLIRLLEKKPMHEYFRKFFYWNFSIHIVDSELSPCHYYSSLKLSSEKRNFQLTKEKKIYF
jgi:hypothetical protein